MIIDLLVLSYLNMNYDIKSYNYYPEYSISYVTYLFS